MEKNTINFKIDYEGADPSSVTWNEFKEFVDAIINTIKAMNSKIESKGLIPISVTSGSINAHFIATEDMIEGVKKMSHPPQHLTIQQKKKIIALEEVLSRKNAKLYIQSKDIDVRFEQVMKKNFYTENSSNFFMIERVGGSKKSTVTLKPKDGNYSVTCPVDKESAIRFGQNLFGQIMIFGVFYRDIYDNKIVAIKEANEIILINSKDKEISRTFEVQQILNSIDVEKNIQERYEST